jgi:hypothetical protein
VTEPRPNSSDEELARALSQIEGWRWICFARVVAGFAWTILAGIARWSYSRGPSARRSGAIYCFAPYGICDRYGVHDVGARGHFDVAIKRR